MSFLRLPKILNREDPLSWKINLLILDLACKFFMNFILIDAFYLQLKQPVRILKAHLKLYFVGTSDISKDIMIILSTTEKKVPLCKAIRIQFPLAIYKSAALYNCQHVLLGLAFPSMGIHHPNKVTHHPNMVVYHTPNH